MKNDARVAAAIELLARIEAARVPMDSVCGDYFRTRRFIGSGDRSAIVERVYAIMRAHARLSWWLKKANLQDRPRYRVLLWLILGEKLWMAALDDLFTGNQYAPEKLDEAEKAFLAPVIGQPLDHADMDEATRNECPPEAYEKLKSRFGDAFATEMAAMLQPATLDLRTNTFRKTPAEVIASLKNDGIEAAPTALSPAGLRVKGRAFLAKTKAFNKGWVDIQDEGSQLIAYLCAAKPGMQVLDACAGGGGKTLALGAMMEGKGRIVAMDNDTRRLSRGKPRYVKAGIHNVEARSLEEEQHRKWLRRQKETFDVVLIDAPCSSSGTWRRNPDLRWRRHGPALDEIKIAQAEILEKFSKCVKPGGRLVYATCSLLPEENDDQIATFLGNHPEYSLVPLEKAWGEAGLPGDAPGKDMMRLSPAASGTDGFFAAVLQRNAA